MMIQARGSLVVGAILLFASPGGGACFANSGPTGDGLAATFDVFEGPIYETHPYYYDGTYRGLTQQIPAIAELGAKVLYILPIWEHRPPDPPAPANLAIYLIDDYDTLDPVYGSEQDLRVLVDTAHQHGMKVLFDLVTCCAPPNSVPWNNDWIIEVSRADLDARAALLGWTLSTGTVDGYPLIYHDCSIPPGGWLQQCDFIGVAMGGEVRVGTSPTVFGPAIDRMNPAVIEYFARIAAKYVRDFDIDGWRIDAPRNMWNAQVIDGDHSNLQLLRQAKAAMTTAKPGTFFLSESSSMATLDDNLFDEVAEVSYDYPFLNFLGASHLQLTSAQLVDRLNSDAGQIQHGRTRARFLETHDTDRVNAGAGQMNRLGLVLQATIPGVPMIQAGQEIGATNAWFSRGAGTPQVSWETGDDDLRAFYQRVFRIRAQSRALQYGSIRDVWKSGDQALAYVRETPGESAVVVLNPRATPATSALDLSFLASGTVLVDQLAGARFTVTTPESSRIRIPAYGALIAVITNPNPRPPRRHLHGAAPTSLARVKVAVVYERLDDARPKRTLEEQLRIFRDTRTDLIFRASWRWHHLPTSCSEVPVEQQALCANSGYSFDNLTTVVAEIKKQRPTIIIGAIPAQKIDQVETDDVTNEAFTAEQTLQMALDPMKWGISSPTRDELQAGLQQKYAADGRYPDISNPQVQALLLHSAERMVDSGMDGIWIDLLFTQSDTLRTITGDVNHPAVQESYEAASRLVDEIHEYGRALGRSILVGTWTYPRYPYPSPKLDFVTESPTHREISDQSFDAVGWANRQALVAAKFGSIPLLTFVDWADDNGQLAIFSQRLSKQAQASLLAEADSFFEPRGMKFMYPVHGGNTGSHAAILSYGQYAWYDSLAPEFETYDTIRQLAQSKAR